MKIEGGMWIRAGATIRLGVNVGKISVANADGVVTGDVRSITVVVGYPARLIGRKDV